MDAERREGEAEGKYVLHGMSSDQWMENVEICNTSILTTGIWANWNVVRQVYIRNVDSVAANARE